MLPAKRSFFRVERKPKAEEGEIKVTEVAQRKWPSVERVPWPTEEFHSAMERRETFEAPGRSRLEISPLPLRLSEMLSPVDYLPNNQFNSEAANYAASNWDAILAEIKGRLVNDNPIDEDRWLPVSLQELEEQSARHIYLLHGAVGVGKSHMAFELANQLQLPLIEIGNASADGRRRPKQLEDLLKGSQHQQSCLNGLWSGPVKRSELTETIILIDEIDLVWPADRGFYPALSAYLKQSPTSHIIILTCNADPRLLKPLIEFPLDCRIRHLTGVDRRKEENHVHSNTFDWPIEWFSLFDSKLESQLEECEADSVPLACCIYDDFALAPAHAGPLISALHTQTLRHYSRDTWILEILPHWSRMERHVLENAAPARKGIKRHQTHVKGLPMSLIRQIREYYNPSS